jgi:hypothetical protein
MMHTLPEIRVADFRKYSLDEPSALFYSLIPINQISLYPIKSQFYFIKSLPDRGKKSTTITEGAFEGEGKRDDP